MRNQLPAAIASLQHATQVDPDLWEAWYELGRAHMKGREWNYALSALRRAQRVHAQSAAIYSAMATCLFNLKKKSDARQMLNEALQRDPKNAEAIHLQKQL
jgi:cytochrome c-type biogenesis protein CcmH/NrfG